MKNLLIYLLFLSPFVMSAQTSSGEQLLNKIQVTYEKYKSFESEFEISITFPGEEAVIQKGNAYQKEDMFCLEMKEQMILSDGKAIWTYNKADNKVNISDVEQGSEFNSLSPSSVLKEVLKVKNKFRVENITSKNGQKLKMIEIAPLDRDAEYFKYQITINENSNLILSIKSFAKDGSRFLLSIHNFNPNVVIKDSKFVFDKKEYPGVEIEDLRL